MNNTEARQQLGRWLQHKRLGTGLTQAQLAKLIGRTPTYVSKYEAGRKLELVELVSIAKILKAHPNEALKLIIGITHPADRSKG